MYLLDVKRPKCFRAFTPLNPHQGATMNLLHSLQHLETPTSILQLSKIQSWFKKWTLVKLLGQMPENCHWYLKYFQHGD